MNALLNSHHSCQEPRDLSNIYLYFKIHSLSHKKKKKKKEKKKRKYTLYIIVRVHFSNKPDTKQSPKKKKKGCHILQNYNLNHPKPTILTSLS